MRCNLTALKVALCGSRNQNKIIDSLSCEEIYNNTN